MGSIPIVSTRSRTPGGTPVMHRSISDVSPNRAPIVQSGFMIETLAAPDDGTPVSARLTDGPPATSVDVMGITGNNERHRVLVPQALGSDEFLPRHLARIA